MLMCVVLYSTQRATWLGNPIPLDLSLFHKQKEGKDA
jgi:hypothetical protein